MAKIGESVGIGAILSVDAHTPAFTRFYGELYRAGIEVVDRDSLHITLVDSRETRVLVRSERDQLALDNARNRAGDYLSSLALGDLCLYPDKPTVQPLGHQRQKVGIYVNDRDEILKEIRDHISTIFYQEARLRVGLGPNGRPYEPHINTGKRVGKSGSPAARRTKRNLAKIKVPRYLHIKGFDIGERVLQRTKTRVERNGTKYDRRYTNSPPRIR